MYSRRSRGYILPPVSNCGVWRGTPLEVVFNNHSPAPIYGEYLPRMVVLGVHMMLLVLAALVICVVISVGIVVPWSAPGASVLAALVIP